MYEGGNTANEKKNKKHEKSKKLSWYLAPSRGCKTVQQTKKSPMKSLKVRIHTLKYTLGEYGVYSVS